MERKYSRNGIVALCSLVYFVSYFSRKDYAAAMAAMLSDGVIDKSVAGLIGTMMFIFYGVGQLLSGYLGDKLKPQYLIYAGLGTTALCNILMPFLPISYLMIPIWGLNGLAQAMLWPPIVKILSNYLDHERYVSANLIVTSAAHVSTILLYLYVPVCIEFMSWRTVFVSASLLSAVAIAVFAVALRFVLPKEAEVSFVSDASVKPKESLQHSDKPLGQIMKETGVIPIFICIIMCGFLRDGIESWLPTLYSEAFNRDPSESILVSVILPIFSIVSVTAITALHKGKTFNNEVRGSAILFIFAIALCVPLAVLIGRENAVARFVSLFLAAFICAAMHGVNFLLISCVPGRFAKFGRASTFSGLTNSFIYIGAASSMYGIALISDNFGWSVTVITWMGVALIGVLLAIPAYKRYSDFVKSDN